MNIFKKFRSTGPVTATGEASLEKSYNRALGQFGERAAQHWLKKMGYAIADVNFRCQLGEVDIIAWDGDELAFIEVKTRTNTRDFLPCEAVNRTKQEHIRRCAAYYITEKGLDVYVRFDVAEVYAVQRGSSFQVDHINHIKGSFE